MKFAEKVENFIIILFVSDNFENYMLIDGKILRATDYFFLLELVGK